MSEDVKVAIITGIFTFVGSVIAVFGTTKYGIYKMTSELATQMKINEERLKISDAKTVELTEHIKQHNGYAKVFTETMPVIKYRLDEIDKRLGEVENNLYKSKI